MRDNKATKYQALPALRRLGYQIFDWEYFPNPNGRKLEYWKANTPNGVKKVKVHARSNRPDGRYPIGVTWQLFETVDEFVLWLEREPSLFIVPAEFFKQTWIAHNEQKSQVNQWYINLRANSGRIERPDCDISCYRYVIPSES
jgi:hypothetical protein